jgi:hypothetical protein
MKRNDFIVAAAIILFLTLVSMVGYMASQVAK